MVREAAVHGVEEELCVFALIDLLCEEAAHAVRKVERYLEVGVVALVFAQELDVVGLDVDVAHGARLCSLRGGTVFVDPGLDLAETGVQTYRKGVLAGDLHAVVFAGIVAGCYLHRSLVAVVGCTEVHQRSAAEADVVHVGAGIGDALKQGVVNLLAGKAAVAAHQNLVGLKKLRQEITYLVSCGFVEIHSVDSADVVSVKCSHGYLTSLDL